MADPVTTAVPSRRLGEPRIQTVSRLNVANLLTLVRFLLVVPFAFVIFAGGGHAVGWRVAAALLFLLASATDRLDGQVARRYGLVTDLGKFADPLADKVLTGTALVALSVLGELWWWLTLLVLVREFAVTVLRSALARKAAMPASKGGKAKTVLLTIGIGLLLLPIGGAVHIAGLVALVGAAAVSTVTGVDYGFRGARIARSR